MSSSQIFICGTGRSGTNAIAMLLHTIPNMFILDEPRFTYGVGGFPSFIVGGISLPRLIDNIATHFNQFVGDYPSDFWPLPDVYTTDNIRKAFASAIDVDANAYIQCYQLMNAYANLGMTATARTQWALKEPGIISQVAWAAQAFPNFKLIHVIREPKDTCCSMIAQPWGKEGLEWATANYTHRLRDANFAASCGDWIKQRKVHVISLENFLRAPEYSIKMLLSFLELNLDSALVQKLIDSVDASKSKQGAWRKEFTTTQAHVVDSVCNSIYYDFIRDENESLKVEQNHMWGKDE